MKAKILKKVDSGAIADFYIDEKCKSIRRKDISEDAWLYFLKLFNYPIPLHIFSCGLPVRRDMKCVV